MSYLERLAARLIIGLADVPEEVRARHGRYLRAAQNPDGGFSGREGPSDLYYTGFALRSLAVLGDLGKPGDVSERTPDVIGPAAGFLQGNLHRKASVVDFFSLLYSCRLLEMFGGPNVLASASAGWQDRTAFELESFRTADGGYAKTPGGAGGSTYHSFLVALCYELIERPLPEPERLLHFVESRRRDDGGFVEIAAMKRSGTNPTAAGVALLRMLRREANSQEPAVVDFLARMISAEGGLRANGRVPLADLLSTFTGLWTLEELGASHRVAFAGVRRFVEAVADPAGGFRAGLWDERADVEYTFYGLGTLALLAPANGFVPDVSDGQREETQE